MLRDSRDSIIRLSPGASRAIREKNSHLRLTLQYSIMTAREQLQKYSRTNAGLKLRWLLFLRGMNIALLCFFRASISAITVPITFLTQGKSKGSRRFYREIVTLIEQLGPTFVKFGQVLSSRRDVLPQEFCAALSALHDRVPAMKEEEVRSALAEAYGDSAARGIDFEDMSLLASGSIASVFRAVLEDGREVALKLRRQGIERKMAADLCLLEWMVRCAERLPRLSGMPLGDLIAYLSTAILGQLDFAAEAANLQRIHNSLSIFPSIRVPAPLPELCASNCLAMEYIAGLRGDYLDTLPFEQRAAIADTALMAVGQLMFKDGFAHCDLHPGNLYVLPGGKLVILDAGYSVPLPPEVRLLMAEFFFCMATRKGRRCAEIILESAAHIRPGAKIEEFISAVDALIQKQSHLSFLSMASFGNEIFELQQRFGLYAKSDFAFPLMSLAVLEGTLRRLNPSVDFQQLGHLRAPSSQLVFV